MSSRLRVLLLVFVLVVAGAVSLALVLALRQTGHVTHERTALVYEVPGEIEETPPRYGRFVLGALRPDRPSLFEVSTAIRKASKDDDVRALVLHVGGVDWGWARIAEMRDALATFRASGKPVWVSLQGGGNASYLLASSGTRIAMPPTSSVFLNGLTASAMFLKGSYDKLGISPNFAHVGQFKSAVEQYTRTDLSPAARLAMDALLDDEYSVLVDGIAGSRAMTSARVRQLIDDGPYTAHAALRAGLADTLLDEAELDSLAVGQGAKHLVTMPLARYVDDADDGVMRRQIAVVTAQGTIVGGRSREGGWGGAEAGSETVIRELREVRGRRSVAAVVLRIDSPGGDGQASDDIWREVRRLRRVKPVVVSMSNLAASGGYYIACGADAIVAQPGTITGSIGVFGGKLNVLGLYRKLGLNVETLSRGRHAEMMSPFKDFSPEEAGRFQAQLEEFYRTFVSRVSEGRALEPGRVDSIGQGRVWSGIAAKRLGLVDTLGGLGAAVEIARRKAHVGEDAAVVLYPRPQRPYLRRLLADVLDEPDDETLVSALPPVVSAWLRAARFPVGAALAMLPYSIDIR
jgi:protease-4